MGLGSQTLPLYNPSSFGFPCISRPAEPTPSAAYPPRKVQRGSHCSRRLTLKSCNQHLTVDECCYREKPGPSPTFLPAFGWLPSW